MLSGAIVTVEPVKVAPYPSAISKLYVNTSPSISDAYKSNEYEVSSSKEIFPIWVKVGASLTEITVTVNVWEVDKLPSVTVAINDSLPLKLEEGVNVIVEPSIVDSISVPAVILYIKSTLSTSEPTKDKEPDSSSSKLTRLTAAKVGASFTAFTVIDNIPSIEVWLSSSVTVKIIESSPL